MKAVVMAGGFGTRIQPLTHSFPKPMLNVCNTPMMETIITSLRDSGITEIVVLLYYMPEVIQGHFGDGSHLGVNISYILPDDDYGTAGALKKAAHLLDERFIIVSGDLVTDFNFREIIGFHEAKKSELTITLTPVDNPLQFGVVIADGSGRIEKFLEKPSWSEVFSDTINTGIYIIEPHILSYIPENTNFDFAKDLFPLLMREGKTLWGCSLRGYWRDVGNPESYREVHQDIFYGLLKRPLPSVSINAKVEGVCAIGEQCSFGNNVTLKNVILGNGVIIGDNVSISDSVIWDGVTIHNNSSLHNSVICSHSRFGEKVSIPTGAIIAQNCIIGDGVLFQKDVTVWPEKTVESGAVINSNIVWGNTYKNAVFDAGKVIGRTNLELTVEMAAKLGAAFGTMLPLGSKVLVSRDYHKSSRMLKRAFLGGLLSAGINVIDLRMVPSVAAKRHLSMSKEGAAGVHFRQSPLDHHTTEILFFTEEGLMIDTNTEKSCERIFFRESFRYANVDELGEIAEKSDLASRYTEAFLAHVDNEIFKKRPFRVAVDLLFGPTAMLYPEIINGLGIGNIILNAYFDDKKLSRLASNIQKARDDIGNIVANLHMDAGMLLYPNGQRLALVCNNGIVQDEARTLLAVLTLIDLTASAPVKVALPVFSPTIMDGRFRYVEIERMKLTGLKASTISRFDFMANMKGSFAFTEWAYHYDALFSSVKIIELLIRSGKTVEEIIVSFPEFYYKTEQVGCPSSKKGKVMRKFMEEGIGKEASFIDGVKISLDEQTWILLLPEQNTETVLLSVQAKNSERGEAIMNEFANKISQWIEEA